MVEGAGDKESAASVSHQTYAQLEDFGEEELNDMGAVIAEIQSKAAADAELWVAQYEAMTALRVLNKFHTDVLQKHLSLFHAFIIE